MESSRSPDAFGRLGGPLALALEALDVRLARETRRIGACGSLTPDELRGLYASPERIDRILTAHLRNEPVEGSARREPYLAAGLASTLPAWRAMTRTLAPTPLECDIVLLALAREIRLDYEILFGYLNDDLTRRWPTRDLAVRLLAQTEDERVQLREALGESAPLAAHGLLRFSHNGPPEASWLSAPLSVSPLAAALLVGAGSPQSRLPSGVSVHLPGQRSNGGLPSKAPQMRLARIACSVLDDEPIPLIVLEGKPGSGRTRLAMDLANAINAPLLRVDLRMEQALPEALLWQHLQRAVILIDGADSYFTRSEAQNALPGTLTQRLVGARGPVLLRVGKGARWRTALEALATAHVEVPDASATERIHAWRSTVSREHPRAQLADTDACMLADRFSLSPGKIARVVQRAAREGLLDPGPGSNIAGVLSEAARCESRGELGELATRAPTPHAWSDLVLPAPTTTRLRDFCSAIRDRAVVLDRWGFGHRAVRSRGLSALFAGVSGTGKTMAASVIARELSLDLFVIDLSAVVSKYIGETEKNLDKVFRAARDAGAILFFDEADALFGKRSEVKDAHDRHANVEVAYLLQELDAHDGVVILASNLSRNLDAAFSRRMRYVIEFPPPGEADRLRLWRGIFPTEAPLGPDVDLPFLAGNFPLAGGDIRNVALDAAFLAAAEDGNDTISMRHLVRAMARQMHKQGKTPSATEFRQFVGLLEPPP